MPIVEITLVEGRPAEARASMMKQITDVIEKTLGAPRQSIRVIIREVPAFHFAVGGEPKGLRRMTGSPWLTADRAEMSGDAPRLEVDALTLRRNHSKLPGQGDFDVPSFLRTVLATG
jgi:4-oxalocrotonate tautomerase